MRSLMVVATSLLLIVSSVTVSAGEADPAGNGIVMMVHGHFEPWVEGPPPALEALLATQDGDRIVLHTIAYTAEDDTRPIAVQDPVLRIVELDGTTEEVAANGDPNESQICQDETNLPGHEGPIEACAVFDLPADSFEGRNVVLLELLFTDEEGDPGREVYNAVAHYFLHAWMESDGGTLDLQTVDETFTDPTPYVVEHLIDPVP